MVQEEKPEVTEAPQAEVKRRRVTGRGRRMCPLCAEQITVVDYKNISFLRRFMTERGRIESRRKLHTCAKHQRALARAIKRARHLALLPFTADHIREMGWPSPTPVG